MNVEKIADGTVHKLPVDLKQSLNFDHNALSVWQSLTPLARNEWICWTVSVKQKKTRDNHVNRVISELKNGKRRPCCWMGCIHRDDKPISQSLQRLLNKEILRHII